MYHFQVGIFNTRGFLKKIKKHNHPQKKNVHHLCTHTLSKRRGIAYVSTILQIFLCPNVVFITPRVLQKRIKHKHSPISIIFAHTLSKRRGIVYVSPNSPNFSHHCLAVARFFERENLIVEKEIIQCPIGTPKTRSMCSIELNVR